MKKKILLVDDEEDALFLYQSMLKDAFQTVVTSSQEKALSIVQSDPELAVIVSDLEMPGMNGIELLKRTKKINKNLTRVILTGRGDMDQTMRAINEGHIFRFLTKPCSPADLRSTMTTCLEQARLIAAEKELLEKTLLGSIKILNEILSVFNPIAFAHSTRIRKYAKHICGKLQVKNAWQFEVAALLSQIGHVTLSTDLVMKSFSEDSLTASEQQLIEGHPEFTRKLLSHIPRFEIIAQIISLQSKTVEFIHSLPETTESEKAIKLGSQILQVAIAYDQALQRGKGHKSAIEFLEEAQFAPKMIQALSSLVERPIARSLRIKVTEVQIGMISEQDIVTKDGRLLIPKGQEMTSVLLTRLKNFHRQVGIKEPVYLKSYVINQ